MFAKFAVVFALCFLVVARTMTADTTSVTIEKVAEPVQLGEAPHWDVKSQKLYYVDIDGQKIFRYDPATGKRTYAYLKDGPVGVVIPVKGTTDKLIAGVGQDVVIVTWDGESNNDNPPTKKLASLDTDRKDTRVNDGKCDPTGRFWIGTVGVNTTSNRAALYLVGHDGTAKKMISSVSTSNGLIWSLKNDVMYYIDTPTFQITAYDYNNADGSITNKRILLDLVKNNITGRPDGMTHDSNGNLWICLNTAKSVIQVDPNTGKVLRQVELAVNKTTSLAFGGKDLDVLYVTSIRDDISADSGALFSVKGLGVKGLPPNDYVYSGQF